MVRAKKTSDKKRGQTLIETIVALGILIMGLMGLIALLARSFAISNFVSENYTATYLAAEGIEVVKNLIDHNYMLGTSTTPWNGGFSSGSFDVEWSTSGNLLPYTGGQLLLDRGTGLYSYQAGGVRTKFIRTIYIQLVDSDHMKVNSKVTWTSSAGFTGLPVSSDVNLEDHFYNLRQ